jgi:hypothetical protein
MVEHPLKGLCYNCDDKYFSGYKCKEKKLFMDISKDFPEEKVENPPITELPEPTNITLSSDLPKVESVISLNALIGSSSSQTLKLIDYINKKNLIILIDSRRTHNFIDRRISQEIHCYVHAVNKFQIIITNGGSMKCGGRCENVRLQIG